MYKRSLSLLITGAQSKVAKISLVVLWVRWMLEKSGVWGAAGHPSSSQWRVETAQGDVSHVTGEGSWVSSMSWCTAHPSCVRFYVIVRCTSILRGILCHCTLHIHLAWNFISWTVCGQCVCDLLFINRCMRPEGPWQRLAAAFAGSSGVFIHSLILAQTDNRQF